MMRGTVYEGGYGLIARKVMRDPNLHPTAKAIYAYLCSFAGASDENSRSAFPSVSLMKTELGIKSQDTFYKYMNQLKNAGYLSIEKQREEGKFERNVYYIEAVPVPKSIEPQDDLPCSKKSTTVKSTTIKSTTKNRNTNITSFNNTSFNNTSIINNHHQIIEGFTQIQSDLIYELKFEQKIDDDLFFQLLNRLKGKNFKHKAYVTKTLETIKNEIVPHMKSKNRLPDYLMENPEMEKKSTYMSPEEEKAFLGKMLAEI